MKLFISPHPDDETLFGAYTIMREKPLVVIVTNPTLQGNNGHQRLMESYEAMRILDVPICFLGINENGLSIDKLVERLTPFKDVELAYIPEYEEGGNQQHNIVSLICKRLFTNTKTYKTYTGLEDRTIGKEIIPTEEELELKKKAMSCYQTQIENPNTAHYFETYAEYV